MNTIAKWDMIRSRLRRMVLPAILAITAGPSALFAQDDNGFADFISPDDPPVFDSEAAAVGMFKSTLAKDDFEGLAKLLGLDAAKLRSADGVLDTYKQIREGAAQQVRIEPLGEDRAIIKIGAKLWPLPFPLVRDDEGKWEFDTAAGLEEIVNRRVGENELEAIATLRALVEAQNDYARVDRDGDGVREFAQKLVSGEGLHDGLYWPAGPGEEQSPAGDIDLGELEDAAKGEGYFGYKFKVLKGQGEEIAGGAYDYVINGNMIGGFAVLAWPAEYAETGVQTFAVNQNGIVYEIDLGDATADIVKYIDRFNPDASWSIVND